MPEQADFNQVLVGHKEKYKLEVKNMDTVLTELVIVSEPAGEYIKKYKIKNDKLKPGQAAKIEVEIRDDLELGAFKTAITLEAKGISDSRFSIPIVGTIVNEIKEKPMVSTKPTPKKAKPEAKPASPPSTAITTSKEVTKPAVMPKAKAVKPGIIRDDSDLK